MCSYTDKDTQANTHVDILIHIDINTHIHTCTYTYTHIYTQNPVVIIIYEVVFHLLSDY